MKASTRVKMAVLAGAVCALVALPAFAFADPKPVTPPGPMSPAVLSALQSMDLDAQPVVQHQHMALDPAVIAAIMATADEDGDDAELGDPPVIGDGGGDEAVFPDHDGDVPDEDTRISDAGGDGVVTHQQETTPSIPTTPTVPNRPYLPYTGGNSLGFILAGVAVAALGVAVAAWGYSTGARRADVR